MKKSHPAHQKLTCFLVSLFLFCGLISCTDELVTEDVIFQDFQLETSCETDIENAYILNIGSKKIHKTTCGTADLMLPQNREIFQGQTDGLLDMGYSFCGNCFR